jgi:acetyl esterase/lipase
MAQNGQNNRHFRQRHSAETLAVLSNPDMTLAISHPSPAQRHAALSNLQYRVELKE